MPQQTEPTLEQVVHLITEAAREEVSEGSAVKELLSYGINPAAHEWLDVLGWVREADDLEDGALDVLTLADEKVYDVDAFKRLQVDLRRCDVEHMARGWIAAREIEHRRTVEYGVAYPDGTVIHVMRERVKGEAKAKRDADQGAVLVEHDVHTTIGPWRPAQPGRKHLAAV